MAILTDLHARRRMYPAGADMIFDGQAKRPVRILCGGWASSYKLLPDGTRQILDFRIAGDFIGPSSVFRTADHNIEPLTDVAAAEIVASDLTDRFTRSPQLAIAVLWAAARAQRWWSNI